MSSKCKFSYFTFTFNSLCYFHCTSPCSPSSMASSSSSFSPTLHLHRPRPPLFTPIPEEHDREEEEEDEEERRENPKTPNKTYRHVPAPLHSTTAGETAAEKKNPHKKPDESSNSTQVVNCNKCRPSTREKISIVPLDTNGRPSSSSSMRSPNANLLKFFFSSITGKSPRPSSASSSSSTTTTTNCRQLNGELRTTDEDGYDSNGHLNAGELKRKLAETSRKRDEAVLECSRLKHSMSEMERKLSKLESYCHELKSSIDRCEITDYSSSNNILLAAVESSFQVDAFLESVSNARTTVRHLSRAVVSQIRQFGAPKSLEKISLLLQPYDVVRVPTAAATGKNNSAQKSLLFHLEALLNRCFYEDFESTVFNRGGSDRILDPYVRSEWNRTAHAKLKGLTWEEVLSKGTRHYSEELSGFCDRKMSQVVGLLGWGRAWPEPLLQVFFGAAKSVWLVHLLAWSTHPAVPLFRVESGGRFDPGYMENVAVEPVRKGLHPGSVRMMVAPGFYVHSSVIKCKVACMHN